jgi:hypothetical protein
MGPATCDDPAAAAVPFGRWRQRFVARRSHFKVTAWGEANILTPCHLASMLAVLTF